jgi:hypothetical protein
VLVSESAEELRLEEYSQAVDTVFNKRQTFRCQHERMSRKNSGSRKWVVRASYTFLLCIFQFSAICRFIAGTILMHTEAECFRTVSLLVNNNGIFFSSGTRDVASGGSRVRPACSSGALHFCTQCNSRSRLCVNACVCVFVCGRGGGVVWL